MQTDWPSLQISIIGGGNIGRTLGKKLTALGASVRFGVRYPLSGKSSALLEHFPAEFLIPVKEAISYGQILILAIPPSAVADLMLHPELFKGKTIIDATNSIRQKPDGFETVYHAMASIPEVQVVKCFNSTGFENLENPVYESGPIDMFMAGRDHGAKKIASDLSLAIGFKQCVDLGGDDAVILLEKLAQCWIQLAIMQGKGRDFAFVIKERNPSH